MNHNFRKILVIHLSGLGDLIMLTPALKILRENFPRAKIDIFVVHPTRKELLKTGNLVDEIIVFDPIGSNFFQKLKFIYRLRKRKYNVSICTTGVNPKKGALFSFLIGAKIRVGETRKDKKGYFYTHTSLVDKNQHIIESNIALLKAMGIDVDLSLPLPFLDFGKEEKEFAENFLRKNHLENKILIGFFPASSFSHRFVRWPKEYFIELGNKIFKEFPSTFILIFGGREDEFLCSEIQKNLKGSSKLFLNHLSKKGALIDKCKVFVAADTGLAHIAATTNTNLVSIFGPTNPQTTGQMGPRVRIIAKKCNYPFDFRNPKNYDAKKEHECLRKITPEMIFEKIQKILKENEFQKYERSN